MGDSLVSYSCSPAQQYLGLTGTRAEADGSAAVIISSPELAQGGSFGESEHSHGLFPYSIEAWVASNEGVCVCVSVRVQALSGASVCEPMKSMFGALVVPFQPCMIFEPGESKEGSVCFSYSACGRVPGGQGAG